MSDSSRKIVAGARYHVVHQTRYSYQRLVTLSQLYLHLSPRSFQYQQTESHQIWVTPPQEDAAGGMDYFGNGINHITITTPHKMLLVHAESTVTLKTMSVANAAMELDLKDSPVFVFRNSSNKHVNIVYRRNDGNIGWIDSSAVPASN